ncbi:MAG: cation:dicarboxylase symporter family transporter [Candidatus Gastranaerophilales bacterium]|nr:cation:dicarboxylase symporter family transporter [Candidatus Gastranaerophilales bacterium]
MKKSKLTTMIFIALIAGILVGWLFPSFGAKMQPLAKVFLNMIKMIIAPLLFSVLVTGIAGHGNIRALGRLGLKTIIYFEVVTTIALFIGLFSGHIFKPGVGFDNTALVSGTIDTVSNMAQTDLGGSTWDILSHIIVHAFPTSIIDAMASGDLLQIAVFAIFFAIAVCAIGQKAKPVLDVLQSMTDIMFKFTELVMFFAPIGVFGAISHTIATNGLGIMVIYAKIIIALYLSLIIFLLSVLTVVCRICNVSFSGLIRALKEPALLAFTTATSEAALPKAMKIMEDFGVPKNIVGFVMPTGYTFNMDGSTLYLSLAVLFATQICNIELSLAQQLTIMLVLMLTSKGMAGIPRVTLVVLAGVLTSFHYPLIGVAILLGIDQILDMGRTTVNLIGNCVATVVIACWEKEFDYEKNKKYLGTGNYKFRPLGLIRYRQLLKKRAERNKQSAS